MASRGFGERFNGWQRIGIVLSGAWLAFIGVLLVIGSSTPRPGELVVALVVPIAALWGGAYGLLFCGRWIAAGFDGKPAPPAQQPVYRARVDLPVWALILTVMFSVLLGLLLAPSSPIRRALY